MSNKGFVGRFKRGYKRVKLSQDDADASASSDSSSDNEASAKGGRLGGAVATFDPTEVAADNHTTCVSDKIDALKEVFDEKTCLDLLRNYYEILKDIKLSSDTRCDISGCEYDYSSNTYRLMVVLSAGSVTVGENFIIVKVDGATGYPKVLSVK